MRGEIKVLGRLKEVQRHPQDKAQLHNIGFCPNRTSIPNRQ